MTIWKYDVSASALNISMPQGARILHLEMQDNVPTLWALVNPKNPLVHRSLVWYPTGNPGMAVERADYVGTLLFEGGILVYHLFDFGEGSA